MSNGAFLDAWAAFEGTDPTPLEERYIPEREPWLTSWCRLHSLHLAALAQIDALPDGELHTVRPALRAAWRLADAKYRLYLGATSAP